MINLNKIFNVGLIGYSSGGRIYNGPIISSINGFNILKIFERKDHNIHHARNNFPKATIVSNLEDILEDPNIDLVIIATPTPLHYSLAHKSLSHHKHTIVEKPFTITTVESNDLIKLSKENNKLLSVHHNRTWDSDFLTVKDIIEKKLLGKLVKYECNFNRFRPEIVSNTWKESPSPGSGVLYDLSSHLIHQSIYLFGLPEYITANIYIEREGGKAPDSFHIKLQYPDLNVYLNSSMLVRGELPKFTLLGDKGSFIKYGVDPQEEFLKKGLLPNLQDNWGRENENIWGNINTDINGTHIIGKVESKLGDYRKYYENIYNTLLGKEKLIISPEQGRDVIRIIELAIESDMNKSSLPYTP
ncbi:Gfo/Idh/MocA family oxidoreductase [Clostridium mobile]|uniref:Gfo/Idh/MocA family oxidoreductase n=1 Tax=Clostridium mobile TaxID=2841512 RepID=UPI003CCEF308